MLKASSSSTARDRSWERPVADRRGREPDPLSARLDSESMMKVLTKPSLRGHNVLVLNLIRIP